MKAKALLFVAFGLSAASLLLAGLKGDFIIAIVMFCMALFILGFASIVRMLEIMAAFMAVESATKIVNASGQQKDQLLAVMKIFGLHNNDLRKVKKPNG